MRNIKKIIMLIFCMLLVNAFVVEAADEGAADTSELTETWIFNSITTDVASPQRITNTPISIQANVTGDREGLQYKFVWQKNDWKKWGVIREFSSESVAQWLPKEIGTYTLYVDVKGSDGQVVTKQINFVIRDLQWNNEKVTCLPSIRQKCNEPVQIESLVSGDIEGLQYKYVWEKDNWRQWGVISDFSQKNVVEHRFAEPGNYTIHVDVKDAKGKVITKSISYTIMTDLWDYEGISASLPSPQEKYGDPIGIVANVSGTTENLRYKFVWMKDDWKEWGVLQEFSKSASVKWEPKDKGNYKIYVDVKDADGRVITKTIDYTINAVKWDFDDISISPQEEQRKNEEVQIQALVSGNVTGLKYKFVWQKDDWKEWGVIRNFATDNDFTWKAPKKAGKYVIYVDVKDRDGEVRTKSQEYYIVSQIWAHEGININEGQPEQIYTEIPIKAEVTGETDGLQYKYVWQKNDWKEWGVIRDFSKNKNVTWYPKTPGIYKIYSNVKDIDGRVRTVEREYEVLPAPWEVKKIEALGGTSFYAGDKTVITADVTGKTDGLQYKFVYRYGSGWKEWGVLQEFSEHNSAILDIKKAGDYYVYVDIKDARGIAFDPVIIHLKGHTYTSAGASSQKVSLGKSVRLYPNMTGSPTGLECKYVWMKNNWKEWGVIKEFSTDTSVEWIAPTEGNYTILIDARLNGIVQTKSVSVNVVKAKNGWYYENGYKYYYRDDKKIYDVRSIIGSQANYVLKINKQMSCVTVYAKDGNRGYIIPVVSFACSPGAGTPIGTFYTQNKYRWHHLYGADGQFCTRITGHVLFHSPPYSSFNNHTLWPRDYNRLGSWASAGCVRLRSGDAKWIYDNCSLGTKVIIYNSSVAGPFPKPVYAKIPLSQTWDPTDPYA
ncbi:triple tyrosine motif-containing protein [Roseburia hominis]